MRNSFHRQVLSLTLSATLLAWGLVPPGVKHAHLGGGDPGHRHDDRHEMAHCGSHAHHSDGEHHEHATKTEISLFADFVAHIHWEWLGMDFSMAAPQEPAEGDDDGDTIPPVIIRVMDEVVPTTQAGPSFGRVLLSDMRTPSSDVVWNAEPVPRPTNIVTSIPLCDSARLERSGVLLA